MPIQSTHPDYDRWIDRWTKCRDAAEGEDAVKEAGERYLPKLSAHYDPIYGNKAYSAYKGRASWFGATDLTLKGYVGAVMRRDPSFVVPDLIQKRLDDVTDEGQDATQFVHAMLKELLTTGRFGLLVDKSAEDVAESEPAFIKLYYPENIRNWICDKDGCCKAIVLQEQVFAPKGDDPYEQEEQIQLRELILIGGVYTINIYRQKRDKDGALTDEFELFDTIVPTMRGTMLDEIPFVFVSCDQDARSCSKPPMMDLVSTNVKHYQLDADYRHGLHFTALPTPVFTGVDEGKDYYLGSEVAINLRNENSKAFYLEFQGQGLSAIKDAMTEKREQMASLGAALIQPGRTGKGVETAEAAKIQHAGETSLLSTIVGRVEEGFESALEFVCKWEGKAPEEDAVEVTLNRDFIDSTLSAAEITAMVGAWQTGSLPTNELYWNFQRGGVVNPATTLTDFEKNVTAAVDERAKAKLAALPPAPTTTPDGSDGPSKPPTPPQGGGSGPATHGGPKMGTNTD